MLDRPRPALLAAAACLLALVATGVLAYFVPAAQGHDAATLHGFMELNRPHVTPLIQGVAHLADPLPYALAGLALAALAAARGRPRVALAIPIVLVAAGATSQILKPLLAAPRYDAWLGAGQIAAESWPSGHATAAMALALCAVMAVPARLRPTVAVLGALFAAAVSYSIVALAWHFPSDVLGGFLVAMLWTLLAVGALGAAQQRWPAARPPAGTLRAVDAAPALGIAAGCTVLALLAATARPEAALDFARAHTTSLAGAMVIAALALGLAGSLAAGLVRRPRP